MSSKVLVIGAQGVVGTFISRIFSEAGWEVTRAGRRPETAPDFRLLDLADQSTLSESCAMADIVINTAHDPALAPERTVLREGGVLLDLVELSQSARASLREGNAEGVVISDIGLGGVAYLTLAGLLAEYPEADGVEYALVFSASGSTGRGGAIFSHRLLTGSSHHRNVAVPFPPPLGSRHCLEVGADGEKLLRTTLAGVPIRHYLCMEPRPLNWFLLALNSARAISWLPSAAFTAGVGKVPAKPSEEHVCEWVAVAANGRRVAARTIEGKGYYRMTAAAMLAFADALRSPSVLDGRYGLMSIDEVLTLDIVKPALARHSISISEQRVDGVNGQGR